MDKADSIDHETRTVSMGKKKISGYIKSEAFIGWVAASLIVGFVVGVAFGVYKSGTIVDPHLSHQQSSMNTRLQEAIHTLTKQVEANPEDVSAWIQLGHHYFDAGQAEKAIDAYQKALAVEPQNADVWTDLGVMHRRNGEPEKSVQAFDRAMGIDPTHEISRFNKGIVLFYDLKDEKGAVKEWEALIAINPDAKTPGGETVREMLDQMQQN
jgi:cytochrome c-type biogenesis protein CcmH/NrfG